MTLADLTAALAAAGGLTVALATYYGAIRSARKAIADTTVTTWQGLSAEYKAERDSLRTELVARESAFQERFDRMDENYRLQIGVARERIEELENEIEGLRRSRHRADPTLP